MAMSEGSYMNTLNSIREEIQLRNSTLSTYTKPVARESILTSGVSHTDKALLNYSQEKQSVIEYVSSSQAFAFHWETMTVDLQKRFLRDYVESEYPQYDTIVHEHIYLFLEKQLIRTKKGNYLVKWNGYFIEKLPELNITVQEKEVGSKPDNKGTKCKTEVADGKTNKEGTCIKSDEMQIQSQHTADASVETPPAVVAKSVTVTFKTFQNEPAEKKKRSTKNQSFHVMRAKLQRDKDSFFVH